MQLRWTELFNVLHTGMHQTSAYKWVDLGHSLRNLALSKMPFTCGRVARGCAVLPAREIAPRRWRRSRRSPAAKPPESVGEVFNIGCLTRITVKELWRRIASLVG